MALAAPSLVFQHGLLRAGTLATDTKEYDGTTSSAGTPTITVGSLASGDTATFTQTFDTKHVGTSKVLTPAGVVTDGNSGNNYAVTFVTNTTGVITARAVTVTAVTDTKTYDGSISSAGVPTVSPALISPDSGVFSQTFDNRNAGTGKTLTPSGSITDGNGGNNYAVTFVTNATGVITARAVTVTAVTDTKTYDGSISSAGVPTVSPALISPDSGVFSQTFDNRNAGTGKTLTPSGSITDGNGGNNYNVSYVAVNTGVINKLGITVTAVTSTKTYDGNTSSAGVPTALPAVIAPDAASFVQTYDNRNAGTGKTLTPSGSIDDGNSGANYTITFTAVTTGVINKLAITVTAVTSTKTYDGNASSTGVPTVSPALISPDSGSFSQTFDTANAGTNKTLTPTGTITDGNSGNNYTVTFTAVTTGTINRANAACTVTGYTVAYDGNAHLATGSCLGVLGESLAGLDLSGTSHINAGTFIDTWTFTDVTGNYNDTSGQVTDTITAGTVNGTILYYGGANDPVSNVLVSGAGTLPVSGTSNGSGYYTIPGFGSGSYTMTPSRTMQLCDTQNGVLIDDAALVSEYVVGLTPLSTTQKLAAKVSGTATANISSFDAALIAQKSVGICDSPNISGRWGFAPGTYVHNPVSVHTDNYTAYLMGDVNGDWSSSAVPNVASRESSSPNAVRASLPVGNAQPGTEVTVPFRIDNLNGKSLNSYQFSVAYDPAVLVPADESANVDGTLSGNLNAVYNTPTPGMLRVGVYGAFPTQGDGVYVNLKFRVIGNNGSSSPLTISGFRFNRGTDEVTTVSGRITVGVATAEATLQGRVLAMGGRGVTGARVTATSAAGVVKNGFTTRYGQFIISGLTIGETYTVTVQSRRFVFAPRSVPISDSVTNVDFVAEQ
jgi:hypothetical protein